VKRDFLTVIEASDEARVGEGAEGRVAAGPKVQDSASAPPLFPLLLSPPTPPPSNVTPTCLNNFRPCGSILVESLNGNMKTLGVLESKLDPIRKKLVRRLLEEQDKVLRS